MAASTIKRKIADGEFIITCELTPPKGVDLDGLFEKAEMLRNCVDAFNLTESHAARMAMDPTAVAHLLLDRGIEPIVQMTSRDKNRIAVQAGILGASALGIPNLVFMGGDPPKNGDHPDAKPVFDLFASQLLEAASALKSGVDFTGNKLNKSPDFCLGSVVNPGASNLDVEIENMHRKIDAGASFLQTQAVYNIGEYLGFLEKAGDIKVPILTGVIPIKSVKMASYMNDKVPGINVPDHLIKLIADQGDDKAKIEQISIQISADLVRELRQIAGGLHIMAIGWEDRIPGIFEKAGLTN